MKAVAKHVGLENPTHSVPANKKQMGNSSTTHSV